MKKLSIFEAGIIGLFVGVIVATYVTYVTSSDFVVGKILNWITLRSVFDYIPLSEDQTMVGFFVFTIIVFTLYGVIIGLLVKPLKKSSILVVPLALVLVTGFVEQNFFTKGVVATVEPTQYTASAIQAVPKVPKQYFGMEAFGDLNMDGKDDVAFIINRKDEDRGMLYYLTVALADDKGKTGTNLIFLGDKVNPQNVLITNNVIEITITTGNSTTTDIFYARVIGGNLEKITASTTTQ